MFSTHLQDYIQKVKLEGYGLGGNIFICCLYKNDVYTLILLALKSIISLLFLFPVFCAFGVCFLHWLIK